MTDHITISFRPTTYVLRVPRSYSCDGVNVVTFLRAGDGNLRAGVVARLLRVHTPYIERRVMTDNAKKSPSLRQLRACWTSCVVAVRRTWEQWVHIAVRNHESVLRHARHSDS